MFKQITQALRTAAILSAATLTLVACGGGEDLALNPPSNQPTVPPGDQTTTTPVSVGGNPYTISFEGIVGSTTFAKSGDAWTVSSARELTANPWSTAGGGLIVADQPTSAKNKTSLAFTLASGTVASPGNTQVLVKLMPTGHPNNTCTPSYLATGLSATAKVFTVALSDFKSSNDITESCTALTATGLDLVDIKNIEIIDRKQTTGTTTISVTLTNLNWVVAGTTGGGTTGGGSSTVGGTTTAVSTGGAPYTISFEGIVGATTFAKSGDAWTVSAARELTANPWSTAGGGLIVTDQPTSAKNKTSLGFTLASGTVASPGNTQVLVKLMPTGHPKNTCTPSYLATGLSATAKVFTVALSDFKSSNDITESCTALTATGLDLVDIKNIEIIDRKQTTGTTTISVALTNLNWVAVP